ncbi:hypothetical protein [Jannaschia rubra]|uniref:Uncharacterized protein n=1 Tax=Jannaschia rubra TaxID=282197 RepID=A0A0M6XUJ3_9RHOB|nr:hypothetical protein [Jannaschia rubra]CTQ33875.1 hypothetical protein JAN5088_02661 [Jannaschia rubra]SFG11429.1 hypothetical protein SAMN04488517_102712 [Jannaschia rubra]
MTTERRDPARDPKAPQKVPADSPVGTTHDPNSVTTGTDVEPDDRYPPKTDEPKRGR